MLLLRTSKLPEGDQWTYEIKWDGYRAIAFKTGGKVSLRSRNDNDFALRYPGVTQALSGLPDDTVIDGEIVALDESGRPSFNVLQNYGTAQAPVFLLRIRRAAAEGKGSVRRDTGGPARDFDEAHWEAKGTRQRIVSARRQSCGHNCVR